MLFGACLAALGGIVVRTIFYPIEVRAARAAIRAEIEAILHMLEQERFVDNIEAEISWLEATDEVREFPVKFRNLYNTVFAANAGN
jgi:hypothetical protein